MINKLTHFLLYCLLPVVTGAQQVPLSGDDPDKGIAFPGAEGFGKYTTGGRGGQVYIVSNLNDNGPGSFRAAAEKKGKRIIVFSVSGTIHLESRLQLPGDLTIAGQTAPGDGICIADQPVQLAGNNIIIRYLRFRMGDRYQRQKGMVDGSGGDDAFGGTRRNNIVIDHCSMSWSTDEVFSIYGGDSTTLQWNIISEPLNYSYHFETGDKDWEHHGYGGIWGGTHTSAHHNLFIHCVNRNPRFNGTRLGASTDFVDFRNNVIYNWGHNNIYGGEGGQYNIVNNYFKAGPETKKNVQFRICNPSKNEQLGYGQWYVSGNFVDGSPENSTDNEKGVDLGNDGSAKDKKKLLVSSAFPAIAIPQEEPKTAMYAILSKGGCSLPARDTMDQRLLRDLLEGKGRFIDVQGGYPHGTAYEQTITAWPVLKSTPPPADSDQDGMPDSWESANGLNPADPGDAVKFNLHTWFTNIEIYINSLVR